MAEFNIARADALDGVPHGFFGSGGGQHQFGFGGPGKEEEVRKLRALAADAIVPGAKLLAPHQVHSSDVIAVGDDWDDLAEGRPVADALVTSKRGIVLGIVTADCAPVLFADKEAGGGGAAHAGWRGAVGGVLENTLNSMGMLGADRANISAAIGPTIAQNSYEVDEAFRANFSDSDDAHFAPAPLRDGIERWHFDLPGFIRAKLVENGLSSVTDLAADTFSNPGQYYSYRRASQNGAPNYGRQISMIAVL